MKLILETAVFGIAQDLVICLRTRLSPLELEYQQYLSLAVDMCSGVPADLILATDYTGRHTSPSCSVKTSDAESASSHWESAAVSSDHLEGFDRRHPQENHRYRDSSKMHRISYYAWSYLLRVSTAVNASNEVITPIAKLFGACGLTLGYDLTKQNKNMDTNVWGHAVIEDEPQAFHLHQRDVIILHAHVLDMVMQTIDPGFPSPPLHPETDDEQTRRMAAKNDAARTILRTLDKRSVLPFKEALARTHGVCSFVGEQVGIRFLRNVLATNPHLFDPSTGRIHPKMAPYAHYLARFGATTTHSLHVREVSVSHRKTRESLAVLAGVRGGRRTPLGHYSRRRTFAKSRIRESGSICEAVGFIQNRLTQIQRRSPRIAMSFARGIPFSDESPSSTQTTHEKGRLIPFPPNPYRRREICRASLPPVFIGPMPPRYQPASRFKDPTQR